MFEEHVIVELNRAGLYVGLTCLLRRSPPQSERHMAYNGGWLGTQMRGLGFVGAGRMAVALALLALVGLASTSPLEGGDVLKHSVIALMVLAFLGIAGIAIAVLGNSRRGTKLVVGAIAVLVLSAVFAVMLTPIEKGPASFITTVKGTTGDASGGKPPSGRGAGGEEWLGALAGGSVLIVVLVLVAAVALAERRRRRFRDSSPSDNEEAVIHALDESLDDLRSERDVRRAIIACYARMERALERAGNARRPAEAPFEYLGRILEQLTGSGRAARALTEQFERAKFSVEPMGDIEKQQAIGALELLRAEVGEPL
jgi:hypothetical protein